MRRFVFGVSFRVWHSDGGRWLDILVSPRSSDWFLAIDAIKFLLVLHLPPPPRPYLFIYYFFCTCMYLEKCFDVALRHSNSFSVYKIEPLLEHKIDVSHTKQKLLKTNSRLFFSMPFDPQHNIWENRERGRRGGRNRAREWRRERRI